MAGKIGKGTEVGVRKGKDETSSNILLVTQKVQRKHCLEFEITLVLLHQTLPCSLLRLTSALDLRVPQVFVYS